MLCGWGCGSGKASERVNEAGVAFVDFAVIAESISTDPRLFVMCVSECNAGACLCEYKLSCVNWFCA